MQPNAPYSQPQVPSDYLDQIASTPQVKTMNPVLLWVLIGGILLLGVAIIFGVRSASGGASPSSLTAVAAKIDNLKTVSQTAQENIKSSELRTINSSLTLVLTNTSRDLAVPLKSQKISLKNKKDKTVKQSAAELEQLSQRLEDARLNAVYDRTYAREMTYELKTLRSDMTVLYKNSRSKSLKETLRTGYENLTPLVDDFSSFNGS